MSIMDLMGWKREPKGDRSIWRVVRSVVPHGATEKPSRPSRRLLALRDRAIAAAETGGVSFSVHLDTYGLLPCGLGVGLLGLLADRPDSFYWCGQLARMWPSHDARLLFAATRNGWLFSLGESDTNRMLGEAMRHGYVMPLVVRSDGTLMKIGELR
jgi:hypothetical protein